MTPGEFEELDRCAGQVSENVRLEFVAGKLGAKAVPDGDHERIIQGLIRLFVLLRPDLCLFTGQGLKVQRHRNGRARPDGVLAVGDAFAGQGQWADPAPVLMVVEVTSRDQDTEQRDRCDKPVAYASTGIPIYLLIDRTSGEVTVFSQPSETRYRSRTTVPFGAVVQIPDPIGVALDSEPLKHGYEDAQSLNTAITGA